MYSSALRAASVYEWWPLRNLRTVHRRTIEADVALGSGYMAIPRYEFVAIVEPQHGGPLREITLPLEVVAEMTDPDTGNVLAINVNDADPWRAVGQRINAAAELCASRYIAS